MGEREREREKSLLLPSSLWFWCSKELWCRTLVLFFVWEGRGVFTWEEDHASLSVWRICRRLEGVLVLLRRLLLFLFLLLYRSCRVLLYTWNWLYCNSSMTCGLGFWRACRRSGICVSLVVVVARYRQKVLVEGRRGRLLLLSSISRANVWIENQICSKVSFLFTRVWIEREREKFLWRVLMGIIVVVLILLFLLFFLAAAASGNR